MSDHEKESIELMIKANNQKLDDVITRGENHRIEKLKKQLDVLNELRNKAK